MKVFGHPLHAVLSDFPVALLVCGVGCDAYAWLRDDAFFARAGWLAGLAAMAFVAPMAVTGLLDLRKIADTPHVKVALWHMSLMITAVSIYGLGLVLREALGLGGALTCETIAVAIAMGGAWFGGHLVFGHGVGVTGKS